MYHFELNLRHFIYKDENLHAFFLETLDYSTIAIQGFPALLGIEDLF